MNQNYLGELSHKPRNLPKLEKRGYTRIYRSIYKMSYMSIYTTFEVLRIKIANEGILVKMGVTKPIVTSTKELQNHQRDTFDKWYPYKH